MDRGLKGRFLHDFPNIPPRIVGFAGKLPFAVIPPQPVRIGLRWCDRGPEVKGPMGNKTIVIASDHAGLELKRAVTGPVEDRGYQVIDLGTDTSDSVDYPDFADKLAAAMKDGVADRGILICGTGIGISIAANRHPHIRAALCHNTTDARLSRAHNDANVIAFGARTMGVEVVLECVSAFLETAFDGGRHARRVGKLTPDIQDS